MQFAILRHAKIKAPLMGAAVAHNYRTSKLEKVNIDPTRTLRLPLKSGVLSFVQNVDKELSNGGKASTSGIHAGI